MSAIANQILNFRFGGLDQRTEHRAVNAQGGDETCEIVKNLDDTYSVKTPNGMQWLSIQSDGSMGWRLVSDPVQPGPWEKFTRQGNVLTELPKDNVTRALVQFLVRDDGGTSALPAPGASTPQRAPRLHMQGSQLATASGQIVFLNGATFFAAPWLVCERGHAAVAPSMTELRDRYDVNCLVEFCMSVNVQKNLFGADPCIPARYGNHYFDLLGEHADRAAEQGQYLYLIAGPDHGLILEYTGQSQFRDFWSTLVAWAREVPNVLLKPTNEGFAKAENYVDVYDLEFPDFCPVAATDYGVNESWWAAGGYPKFADWGGTRSCGDIHPPRTGTVLDARECVALNNVYVEHDRCLFISEAIRLGSNGSAGATRRLAELVGAASRVGAAMRVFHSLLGEQCKVFDAGTRDHAEAYFARG